MCCCNRVSFANDFDIMQSNVRIAAEALGTLSLHVPWSYTSARMRSMILMQGRTYWTMPFGKDKGTGGTDQNGKPVPGADGPPWMMACLRSVDRGATFELINTDSTLGLGRDREATENQARYLHPYYIRIAFYATFQMETSQSLPPPHTWHVCISCAGIYFCFRRVWPWGNLSGSVHHEGGDLRHCVLFILTHTVPDFLLSNLFDVER
jgi:hypothetical protein